MHAGVPTPRGAVAALAVPDRARHGYDAALGLPPASGIIRAMAAHVARSVTIHGHVQGVWFRDSARYEARSLGVGGWVRNRSDGTVQAWLEGPPDAVAAIIDWCRVGPPRARVERVDVTEAEPEGVDGFDVR